MTLVDSVNPDNNVSILPSVMSHETGNAPYFGIRTGIVPAANTISVWRASITSCGGGEFVTGYYWIISNQAGDLRWGIGWGNRTGYSHTTLSGTSNVVADTNWHTFILYDKRFWLCDPDIELTDTNLLNIIATQTPLIDCSTATWGTVTNDIKLFNNEAFTTPVRGKRALNWIGTITGETITWQKKYVYTTHRNGYDILNAGTKVVFKQFNDTESYTNPPITTYSLYGYDNLTNGHTLSYLAGTGILSVPKAENGFITDLPTGFVQLQQMNGDVTNHNQSDSKLRFASGSIWDRSDTDVWSDDCRSASDYDAGNPTDWHISNINALQLYEWLNNDYKYILGCKFDPNSVDIDERLTLEELFTFPANLTENEMHKVWKYTNDYNLIVI
jgi:hypothetical protein